MGSCLGSPHLITASLFLVGGPEASTKDPFMNREQDADSVPDSEATMAASCLQLDLGCLVFMLYVVRFSIHVCSLCQ